MGSGKTYWGSRWAQQYGLPFIDLDAEIEREAWLSAEMYWNL
ncbi:MAG TPA: shikimate kinase, partial [Ferruginibacter sp.]|nr:shikimate kinase [Ferruginibacter sp.]